MFIRLFIKTDDNGKAIEIVNNLISYINEENIKYKEIKNEPYWKYDDVTVSEIKLELNRPFQENEREDFLNIISNKWVYLGEEEVISSTTIDCCKLNFNLEMINVFFS
jgi:hypothetical protein